MRQNFDSGRRQFLKETLASVLASSMPLSLAEAKPHETQKGSQLESTVESETEKLRNIGKKIAQAFNESDRNKNPKGYRNAYETLISAYNDSAKGFKTNELYVGFGLVALMHAAKVLLEAGNNIVEGRPFGDIYRGNNLKRALEHYGTALQLRMELDRIGSPITMISTPEIGFIKVADEKLIRKKIAKAYEDIVHLTKGTEKVGYQLSLFETYKRLVDLSEGFERNDYLKKSWELLKQIPR